MKNTTLVFCDTEFTDFTNMELISVGLVPIEGPEFYKEINDHCVNFCSAFVQQVVKPLLNMNEHGCSYNQAAVALRQWLKNFNGQHLTFVVDYRGDYDLISKLLQHSPQPLNCTIEFAFVQTVMHDVLFFSLDQQQATEQLYPALEWMEQHINAYWENVDNRRHHALVDARAMHAGWIATYNKIQSESRIFNG